jgi:hypothetical protein
VLIFGQFVPVKQRHNGAAIGQGAKLLSAAILAFARWQGDFTGVNGVDMLSVSDQRGHGGFLSKNW